MSFTINTQASDAIVAIAELIEDLGAASRHTIAADNHKARVALAGYIRDKKAQLEALLREIGATAAVMELVTQAIAALRAQRQEMAVFLREKREAREADLAATQALLAEQGMIAA